MVLLSAACPAYAVHNSSQGLPKLKGILRNVLLSLDNEERKAASFKAQEEAWCSQGMPSWVEISKAGELELGHLRLEAEEHQAAIEELDALMEQAQANMALVQHTIEQGEALAQQLDAGDERRRQLQEVVAGRRDILAALQSEAQALSPMSTRLRADAVELHHRMEAKQEATEAIGVFNGGLGSICAKGIDAEERRASQRTLARNALQDAVKALGLVGTAAAANATHSTKTAAEEALEEEQREEDAKEAALEVIPAEDGVSLAELASTPTALEEEQQEEDAKEAALEVLPAEDGVSLAQLASTPTHGGRNGHRGTSSPSTAPQELPDSEEKLAEVKGVGAGVREGGGALLQRAGHDEWCARERSRTDHDLNLMQDMSAQMLLESRLHSLAEGQLELDTAKIRGLLSELHNASAEVERFAKAEASLAAAAVQEGKLASRILVQASAALGQLRAPGGSLQNDTAAARVASALHDADAALAGRKDAGTALALQTTTLQRMMDAAEAATRSLNAELAHFLTHRKAHEFQRTLCDEHQAEYEKQAREAAASRDHLEEACGGRRQAVAQQRRDLEVRALNHSKRALRGEHLSLSEEAEGAGSSPRNASGDAKAKAAAARSLKNLSPLQRAAAEMGLALEP